MIKKALTWLIRVAIFQYVTNVNFLPSTLMSPQNLTAVRKNIVVDSSTDHNVPWPRSIS